jgi:hypothetical protein
MIIAVVVGEDPTHWIINNLEKSRVFVGIHTVSNCTPTLDFHQDETNLSQRLQMHLSADCGFCCVTIGYPLYAGRACCCVCVSVSTRRSGQVYLDHSHVTRCLQHVAHSTAMRSSPPTSALGARIRQGPDFMLIKSCLRRRTHAGQKEGGATFDRYADTLVFALP